MTIPTVLGGLTYDGEDLQTEELYFDIYSGFNELPEVRGNDDVIPGLPGRTRRNRVDDRLIIELRGWVRGVGGTAAERQQSFRASVVALQTMFDPTGGPGVLMVLAPYLGLPSGSQSISVYPMTMLGGDQHNTMSFMRFSIELEAVDNPPRWTEDST